MSRLDLLWTVKFQNEKHEVETVSTISRLLLENILPKHVAEIIIKENMSQVRRSQLLLWTSLVRFFRDSITRVMIMWW
jgi:hypothetical protein